jgi:hypothetical protein
MVQAVSEMWLSIPQAVFLLLTGDLERARGFPEDDPNFLVFLVSRTLASKPIFVPLDPLANAKQSAQAWEVLKRKLTAENPNTGIYGAGLKALCEILAEGLARAKGSRCSQGSFELIDPVEFTRVELAVVHAIHVVSKEIAWHNVRLSSRDLLELRQSILSGSRTNGGALATDRRTVQPNRSGGWRDPKWGRAREAAMSWLVDYGCPVSGDGNQAKLERHIASWLEDHGYTAGEASIRRQVASWIRERREEPECTIAEGSSGSTEPR